MRLAVWTFLILLSSFVIAKGQTTKIRGYVTDAGTGDPLPFVNLAFTGTSIGTITDENGFFYLQTKTDADTLTVSFVGYQKLEIQIIQFAYQELNIELQSLEYELNEIVVLPGENPAWRIMRNIIANKKNNDPTKFDSYQFEAYNKVEIDVNNIDPNFRDENFLNDFDFIFEYADTSAETGKTYLPVFISESVSDFYYKKFPQREKEIIKANKISGVQNESITQYSGQMYVDVNIYDNYIDVFHKQFVCPVSDFWRLNYKYYLLDSAYINGKHCYHISFKPQRKLELTFTGEFWVHDTTWAVVWAKARIAEDANLNYINDFIVEQQYTMVGDSAWFMEKEQLFVDFNLTDKTIGLFGRKTTSRKNIILNPEFDNSFFTLTTPEETIIVDNASEKDDAYWQEHRHEPLTEKEEKIYNMIDSIQIVPSYKKIEEIIKIAAWGYWVHSWWELGPLYKFYSYNDIEENRFRFGGRTSNKFSKKLMLHGHIAYGTGDKKFKFAAGGTYMFSKKPYRKLYSEYKYDYQLLGISVFAFTEDNIVTTIFSQGAYDDILLIGRYKIYYIHEWFEGFYNKFEFQHRVFYPSERILFQNDMVKRAWNSVTSAEVSLKTHIAYNEKFVMGEFERYSFGSEYPILDADFAYGFKNLFYSDFEYIRLQLTVSHHFDINPLGEFKYSVEYGKIWGEVPFILLKLHEGNETYIFDPYAFNLMNYYEFASDEFLSLYIEHHFNGFFLNKIPLVRRLKFREVIYAKGLIGSLNEKNQYPYAVFNFPQSLAAPEIPYIEAGAGLENILKVFRIDFLWRLTYLDNPDLQKFGVKFSMQLIL